MNNVTPIKPELTPEDNNILRFFHCTLCLNEMPDGVSPRDWMDIEAGWTIEGMQVWCKRHDCNVIHINFEGQKHMATTDRKPFPGEKI